MTNTPKVRHGDPCPLSIVGDCSNGVLEYCPGFDQTRDEPAEPPTLTCDQCGFDVPFENIHHPEPRPSGVHFAIQQGKAASDAAAELGVTISRELPPATIGPVFRTLVDSFNRGVSFGIDAQHQLAQDVEQAVGPTPVEVEPMDPRDVSQGPTMVIVDEPIPGTQQTWTPPPPNMPTVPQIMFDDVPPTDHPRAKTPDEIRDELISTFWFCVDSWENHYRSTSKSPRDILAGCVHSVLATLDGCSPGIPAFDLVAQPHPDDRQYCIDDGDDWFEPGTVLSTCLHEFWHKQPTPPADELGATIATAERDNIRERFKQLAESWHVHTSNGMDVLASHTLDQMTQLIEAVKP